MVKVFQGNSEGTFEGGGKEAISKIIAQAHGADEQNAGGAIARQDEAEQTPETEEVTDTYEEDTSVASAEDVTEADEGDGASSRAENRFQSLANQNSELREAQERMAAELEQARAELAANRKQQEDAEMERRISDTFGEAEAPEGFEDWPLARQMQWTSQQAFKAAVEVMGKKLDQKLESFQQRDVVRDEFPDLTAVQRKAVLAVQEETGLKGSEAMLLARSRNAALFGDQGQHGAVSPSHAVSRPGKGGKRKPRNSELETAAKQLKNSKDRGSRDAAGAAVMRHFIRKHDGRVRG